MPGKAKFIPIAIVAIGASFALWYGRAKPPDTPSTIHSTTSPAVQHDKAATTNSVATTRMPGPADVADVKDWIENGPKEPLVPPVIHVDAELAPGSVATAEPLVPPEIRVDAELAPGSTATKEPLLPPEIRAGQPSQ
ncbi:MAG: hypothetical protein IPM54_01610 [Polyangiaceae bacterium]|nr:hypothetical protein [Polyangiaceae bacterium]